MKTRFMKGWTVLALVGCLAAPALALAGNNVSVLGPNQIKAAQKALNDQGYKAGPVDGQMGKQTASAIRNFQHDKNDQVTGTLDAKTLADLGVSNAKQQAGQASQNNQNSDQGNAQSSDSQ